MTIQILGIALWYCGHFFKRAVPALRSNLGDRGKGVSALLIIAGLVLMILGYRSAEFIPLYDPPDWARHVNNLLMLFAVALFGLGSSKSPLRSRMRHPMLTGALVWAIAHLLVNGDLAAVVLFGALGIWAILEMVVINRSEPNWEPFEGGTTAGTIRLVVISLVVFAVIAAIHTWLGYWPFPG